MQKYFILLVLSVSAIACRHSGGSWRNTEKWLIDAPPGTRPLSGRPRQINEYVRMASDTAYPEKRKLFYKQYIFDADGFLIARNTLMNDSVVLRTDRHLDDNGVQEILTDQRAGVVPSTTSTRRLSDGRYIRIHRSYSGKNPTTSTSIFSFPSDSEEVREDFGDTLARGKADSKAHYFYDGDRPVRATAESAIGSFEQRYFYSHWDAPDSILIYQVKAQGKTLLERELFRYNDHSDPLLLITINGKDTATFEQRQYIYDPKGNWVREISTSRVGMPNFLNSEPTITDREIVY